MQPIGAIVDIDALPNDVWAVLSDVEHWPDWTPTTLEATRLDGGPFAVGSRTRVRQPRLRTAVWVVTRLDHGKRFTWVSRTPGMTMTGDHVIEPNGTGSRVTLSFQFSGALGGLVGWMYGGLAQRYIALEAESLKRRCESTGATSHVGSGAANG